MMIRLALCTTQSSHGNGPMMIRLAVCTAQSSHGNGPIIIRPAVCCTQSSHGNGPMIIWFAGKTDARANVVIVRSSSFFMILTRLLTLRHFPDGLDYTVSRWSKAFLSENFLETEQTLPAEHPESVRKR